MYTYDTQLAQTVVDSGAIAHLALLINNKDAKLKVYMDYVHACVI